jgi:hypothetical protein
MTRLKDPLVWLHGLVAAGINGGSSSVVAGLASMGIAPDKFNLGADIGNTLKMVGSVFTISAILGVILYLRQSPLPPIETGDTQTFKKI